MTHDKALPFGGALLLVVAMACSADAPNSPDTGERTQFPPVPLPSFALIEQKSVPTRPHGVAVSPDGSRVVVSTYWGAQVLVLNGETYAPVGSPVPMGDNWGVEITPDGRRALVAARRGGWFLDLTTGENEHFLDVHSRRILSNSAGTAYYTAGFIGGDEGAFVKFDTNGRIVGRVSTGDGYHGCFAIVNEDTIVTAKLADGVFVVLDAETLLQKAAIPTEAVWDCTALIVLDQPGLVAVVGTDHGKLLVTRIDVHEGRVLDHVSIDLGIGDRWGPALGRGNPWAKIDTGHVILPTPAGFITLDSQTGSFLGLLDVESPSFRNLCCEIAYDRIRNRIIVTGDTESSNPSGRVLVYSIDP